MGLVSFKNRTDTFEVIDTGSICLPVGVQSFKLQISDLIFNFEIKNDKSKDALKVEQISLVDKSVTLALINFDNMLGSAWSSVVGNLNNKELSLSLHLSTVGEDEPFRNLTYTFFTKGGEA